MPPTFFLVLSAALLALGPVLAKGLLGGGLGSDLPPVAPLPFLVCQLAGSLALPAVLCRVQGDGFAVGTSGRVLHIAGGVVGLGAIGTILALAFMPVGEASVVFATQPIVILLLARMLLGERAHPLFGRGRGRGDDPRRGGRRQRGGPVARGCLRRARNCRRSGLRRMDAAGLRCHTAAPRGRGRGAHTRARRRPATAGRRNGRGSTRFGSRNRWPLSSGPG